MIKLDRPVKPAYLTDAKKAELKQKYQSEGTSVWAQDEIRFPLISATESKCGYCECFQQRDARYIEIDHYQHKDKYPNLVVEWSNFLPSCRRCNGKKGVHDVLAEPIINPFDTDPRGELRLIGMRIYGTTALGISTVDVLNLNDFERLTRPRFEIIELVNTILDDVEDKIEMYTESKTTRRKNRLLEVFRRLLSECIKKSEYAAVSASSLHINPNYLPARQRMIELELWNDELEKMHLESLTIKLPA